MNLFRELEQANAATTGRQLYSFAEQLYPICRSITGSGIRETLRLIQERIPLETFDVPTGTRVFDWAVPKEWNIRDAYIADAAGKRVVDFQQCNLHVVNYSVPVHVTMPLSALRSHLHTLPDHPDWVPYRTTYYQEDWGFCLSHKQLLGLEEGDYEVHIDSSREDGHLRYGECYLRGQLDG